jgi:hypothetical protein
VSEQWDGETLARRFHDAYERLAPSFGYETRTDTRSFEPDSPNGRLMVAVATEIAAEVAAAVQAERAACADVAEGIEWRMTGTMQMPATQYDVAAAIRARGDTSALEMAKATAHGKGYRRGIDEQMAAFQPALDAAIQAAEARGVERAAQIAETMRSRAPWTPDAQRCSEHAERIVAAIRALITEPQEDKRDD